MAVGSFQIYPEKRRESDFADTEAKVAKVTVFAVMKAEATIAQPYHL